MLHHRQLKGYSHIVLQKCDKLIIASQSDIVAIYIWVYYMDRKQIM